MTLHEELIQLAHLIRLGAETVRQEAWVRPPDIIAVMSLAKRADLLANAFEKLANSGMHKLGRMTTI